MNTKEKPNSCKRINHSTLKLITELCNLVFQLYSLISILVFPFVCDMDSSSFEFTFSN